MLILRLILIFSLIYGGSSSAGDADRPDLSSSLKLKNALIALLKEKRKEIIQNHNDIVASHGKLETRFLQIKSYPTSEGQKDVQKNERKYFLNGVLTGFLDLEIEGGILKKIVFQEGAQGIVTNRSVQLEEIQ